MRTSQAARYARWAATAALLLAATVAGVYVYRIWQARQARKSAPPAVPATVQQRSAQFSFSKVEENRTLFTVRASRATEFKEGNKNLLEDVWITIYGREGKRFDNIHTQACEYRSDTGRIVCAGEVQMDLESAAEASLRPGERVLHVSTRNVSFNRESGEARTDQPVLFRFPYGEGRAVGVSYSSRNAVIRLHRNVELTLTQPPAPGRSAQGESVEIAHPREPLHLTGGSLEYRRSDQTLRLLAPVRAWQGHRELVAGQLALEFDNEFRAKRLVARSGPAGGRPELRSTEPAGQASISADPFIALFHREGWVERILATGNVRGFRNRPSGEDRLVAEQIEVEMLPRGNQVRLLTASGGVTVQSSHGDATRSLETSALRLFFVMGKKPGERRLDRGETLGPATIDWSERSTVGEKTATASTRLRGQQVIASFDERNRVRQLAGRDGVELERRLTGHPPQATASSEFAAKFGPGGDWMEVEQSGNVRFREADRAAQADHARLERATDNITLTGSVVLSDALSRTTAKSVAFNQRTGDIRAEGDVRTSYLSVERNGAPNLAPQPAHISSHQLLGNASAGRALYSGRARLWQGDSVIEAESIELLRDARQLNARGNVLAVFPEAAGPAAGSPNGSPGSAHARRADLWRIRAGSLTYWSAEGRARLEQSITAQSSQGQISSRTLELFFSSAGPSAQAVPAAATPSGPQQLTRALASGGVTVRQGGRRGTAERAEYSAAEGKFVLSGGRPTLYDASGGTTTGRQLTFFFANDTIVVDSEDGSRTLTRHRVEK